jgi:hypothetical protein
MRPSRVQAPLAPGLAQAKRCRKRLRRVPLAGVSPSRLRPGAQRQRGNKGVTPGVIPLEVLKYMAITFIEPYTLVILRCTNKIFYNILENETNIRALSDQWVLFENTFLETGFA